MAASGTAWWQGKRGEWFVVGQVILLAVVFFGPRNLTQWPAWDESFSSIAAIGGAILFLAGFALLLAGALRLGPGLTPLPYPKEGGALCESGAFGIVRHPMYGGGILMSFGWALWVHGWLTLGYAVVLTIFADIKARREERWLAQRFPEYLGYRRRVRKLVPFVY